MYNAEIGQQVWEDRWFGVEYRVKTSNPHGAANGEFEAWIYDEDGNIISHEIKKDVISFKDGNTNFDHGWNKFDWGGNRFTGVYCPCNAYTDFSFGDNYVIINGSNWKDGECKKWDLRVFVGDKVVQDIKVLDNIGNKIFINGAWSFSGTAAKVELHNPWCEFGPVSCFYIDDIIVDGQRIGPAYFNIIEEHPFIETQSLPSAVEGESYSQSILVTKGKGPYVWQITGNLPAGLSWAVNGRKLVISGIPTAVGAYNFMVEVTESSPSANKNSRDFAITVVDPNAGNQPPKVNAGTDQAITYPQEAVLSAVVIDDGKPADKLTVEWQKVSGPGRAIFTDFQSAGTKVSFSEAGIYELRLTADDGELSGNDDVVINVTQPVTLNKLLIDFGINSSSNIFETEGWNKLLIDAYTGYKPAGPGGTMVYSAYNFQGVSVTESDFARNFVPGEKIIINWYNNSDQEIAFTPLISFTDKDRNGSGETGTWYAVKKAYVPAFSMAESEYEIDKVSAGTYGLVNINVNYPTKDILICDKIELVSIIDTGGLVGDINADGKVTVLDVQLCVNIILGIIEDLEGKADVNGDKEINVSDVQAIINEILGG